MGALTFYQAAGGEPEGTSKLTDGLTLRTGGVTRRAAYAREALSELHDVDNWAPPRCAPSRPPKSAISGAFRGRFPSAVAFGGPVGPIRPESDMGSLGPFWESGVREGERKKQEEERLDNREERLAKRGATRGLPRGSPILVLLSPKHA